MSARTIGAVLGAHRVSAEQLATAELRAGAPERSDSVSAFLHRWVEPLARHYPGTTLGALRELSLRDIAALIYWRGQALAAQNDRRQERAHDDDDELFGEVR